MDVMWRKYVAKPRIGDHFGNLNADGMEMDLNHSLYFVYKWLFEYCQTVVRYFLNARASCAVYM
jgi:hypothetical protein